MEDKNSGFLEDQDALCGKFSATFRDMEIIAQRDACFLAKASRYGRLWLLKGLKEAYADDIRRRQQLMKEGEILSSLSHPGIVSFAGLEKIEGYGLCIVMEWIEGSTLEAALRDGSLTRRDRRRLLDEIVDAVAYIHSKGIVHRDLKPSNIMVRRNGRQAVLLDFGLADTDAYTILKTPAGTLGYMSERQRQASTPDTADDIYSLGVILQSLYPAYHAIVRRCTGTASRRYADASALLRAIRRRDRRKMLLIAAAATALAAIAFLAVNNHRLRTSVDFLETKVSTVTAAQRRTEAQFADSISLLKDRLDLEKSFRDSLSAHDRRMDDIKHRLKSELGRAYAGYLKTLTHPTDQSILGLIDTLMGAKRRFMSQMPDLDEKDRLNLELDFTIYYSDLINRFHRETASPR